MSTILSGAIRPDHSAAGLMPTAASGASPIVAPSLSLNRTLRMRNSILPLSVSRTSASSMPTLMPGISAAMLRPIGSARNCSDIGPLRSRT